MPGSSSAWNWLRLPSRVALLLGLGALSAAGARANSAEAQPGASLAQGAGEVMVRADGGRIYLSEDGKTFEELQLGDTEAARHLRRLLENHGAAASGIRLHPMIFAGAGGEGFHAAPPAESARTTPATKAGSTRTGLPDAIEPSRDPAESRAGKTAPGERRG